MSIPDAEVLADNCPRCGGGPCYVWQDMRDLLSGSKPTGEYVSFWQEQQGWCGSLAVGSHHFSETIGCSSVASCYRSLRGQLRNLMRGLERLGVKP